MKRVVAATAALTALVALAVRVQPVSAITLTCARQTPELGFRPHDVRPGDVDGDGLVDLVLGGDPAGGSVWLEVGDVNADGRADVAVALSEVAVRTRSR